MPQRQSIKTNGINRGRFVVLIPLLLLVFLAEVCGGRPKQTEPDDNATTQKDAGAQPGQGTSGDWSAERPGVRHRINAADLPKPYATKSVDNGPQISRRPSGAMPQVPTGFRVEEFQGGLDHPRLIRTAPNGDLFIAESSAGDIRVLRAEAGADKPSANSVFASGLELPFGIAFYPPGPNPQYVYIGETGAVVRYAYKNGDMKATDKPQTIVPDIPSGGHLRGGGHWTRDIAFSPDGKKMYVSVGSHSNDFEDPGENETNRADILEYNPDGTGFRKYATGIRNAVGIAVNPATGDLWASVNERDELGDDLVPDYVTRVKDGGFYGWPWFYIGSNQDPRHPGEHPELKDKVLVPDVLVQSHAATLEMTFYTGTQFPQEYRGDAFVAAHGSWNRRRRTGYEVIRVFLHNGVPTGEYQSFMTGFVTGPDSVWGRPVGVAVGQDGSLFVSDDGSDTIWRVSYTGE